MCGWCCDVENSAALILTALAPSPVLRASCLRFSVRSFKCFLSDSLVLEVVPRGRPWCPRSAPWPRAASHLGQVLASLLVTCTSLNKEAGRDPKWRTLLSSPPSCVVCSIVCSFLHLLHEQNTWLFPSLYDQEQRPKLFPGTLRRLRAVGRGPAGVR